MQAKPFVKWVGGKGQLLSQFKELYPKTFNKYLEPFVGGGAVFFDIDSRESKINDLNTTLTNTYLQIKNNPQDLIRKLQKLETEYLNSSDRKDLFYKNREKFNVLLEDTLERAVLFLFLNRTCFNGMYRVNSKGGFNVPHGKYKNPTICDEKNLLAVSEKLQHTEITNLDFQKFVSMAEKEDFVYFDPPYYPLNRTSNFTSYTKDDFLEDEQERLANTFRGLSKKGCFVMLSNSNTEFIKSLYRDFKIHIVSARRNINSKASKRGAISELVITNY